MTQNKATRKFLKILEKEIKLFNSFMVEITEKTLTNNVESCRSNPEMILGDELAEITLQELNSDQRKYVNYGHKLKYIKERLTSEEGLINDFALLEEVFGEFRLSEQERIDIIVPLISKKAHVYYKIKALTEHLRMLYEYPQAKIENYENYETFSEMGQRFPMINELVLYIKTGDYSEYLKELDKAYEDIKSIIDKNKCYASKNPEILIPAFKMAEIDLSESITMSIVNYSKKKYELMLEEQEIERKMVLQQDERRKLNVNLSEQSEQKLKENMKIRRNAIHKLKNYIENSEPIKYISDEEMQIVMDLLSNAGYEKHQISKIKKSILENNQRILELQRTETINRAKEKYLSAEEIEVLNKAEELLADKMAQENIVCNRVFTNRIVSSYNYVINALIYFYENTQDEPDYNDDAELMLMFIEELKEDIESFEYSNFKLVHSKKSN